MVEKKVKFEMTRHVKNNDKSKNTYFTSRKKCEISQKNSI